MLLTSNLPFSKWEQIFKDPMTTAAAIDRLVHHSVIVELNVPSYRAEAANEAKRGGRRRDEGGEPGVVLAALRAPSLRSGSLRSARPTPRRSGGIAAGTS